MSYWIRFNPLRKSAGSAASPFERSAALGQARLVMRNVLEILRLNLEQGSSGRAIAGMPLFLLPVSTGQRQCMRIEVE